VTWELFVGLRYLRARRRSFLSLISFISLLGVVIGVATLDIVLAVMTGFEQDLRDKILGMNPHIVVVSYAGPVDGDPALVERVRQVPGVLAAGPFVYGQAMLAVGRSAAGVAVRGIDPKAAGAVVDLERHLKVGRLDELGAPTGDAAARGGGGRVELPGLVLGGELARQLGVVAGEVVSVISRSARRDRPGSCRASSASSSSASSIRACSTTTRSSPTWRSPKRSGSSR
jgi:lipoprotein-releasing system permease protein